VTGTALGEAKGEEMPVYFLVPGSLWEFNRWIICFLLAAFLLMRDTKPGRKNYHWILRCFLIPLEAVVSTLDFV